MNPIRPEQNRSLVHRACLTCGLLWLGLASQAAQATGIDTSSNPELFLTLIDQTTAQMSYTLDLNIKASDFYINAQQDTGSYLFFTLDPGADPALQSFIAAAGANLSTTRWSVLGFNVSLASQNDRVLYSTLTNNGSVATQTASYDKLFNSINNNTFKLNGALSGYIDALNAGIPGSTITQSTLNSAATFGSSLAAITDTSTYTSKTNGWASSDKATDGDCLVNANICVGNPVGTSSWFYQTKVSKTASGTVSAIAKVSVDEFDNLTNDGYWGFIKDPNSSKYILSYTLPGSNPKSLVSTDAGRARLSSTDYRASVGPARLITVDDGKLATSTRTQIVAFANVAGIVPEPQTWGLMALGGLLVAARVRRERRA